MQLLHGKLQLDAGHQTPMWRRQACHSPRTAVPVTRESPEPMAEPPISGTRVAPSAGQDFCSIG
jgi:hypothetical protein